MKKTQIEEFKAATVEVVTMVIDALEPLIAGIVSAQLAAAFSKVGSSTTEPVVAGTRKGGWPKGKKRGPRKLKDTASSDDE